MFLRTLKDFKKTMAVQPFVLKPFIDLRIPLFCDEKAKICQSNPSRLIPYLVRHESLKIHLSFVIFISIPVL